MKVLKITGLVLLLMQVPFLFAAGIVAYADLQAGKLTAGDLPAALVITYWYILRGELMLAAAAVPLLLLGWLLWKLAKWAAKPRPYTGSGSSSQSVSTFAPSHHTRRRTSSHHAAASAGASPYVAQSTASTTPDYFADNPAPGSPAPDYFAGPDSSYDTSSGGGGFDSKDDNSGTW